MAYPVYNGLEFGKIMKINTKMIGVVPVIQKYKHNRNTNKYPEDIVRLEATDMSWYILKNST